jgi:hypothetical protein
MPRYISLFLYPSLEASQEHNGFNEDYAPLPRDTLLHLVRAPIVILGAGTVSPLPCAPPPAILYSISHLLL